MSRKTLSMLSASVVVVSIAGASFANAQDQNNPLHPSYFAGKTSGIDFVASKDAALYVDARNPLHPSFALTSVANGWHATARGSAQRYLDARNPLHPSYARN